MFAQTRCTRNGDGAPISRRARAPRDGWALWGLWQAHALMGDGSRTDQAESAFRDAWLGTGEPRLDQL